MTAGRSCPLSYRYQPASLSGDASVHTETLYVVGGLYGNQAALNKVLELFDQEPGRKHLIFNGDFNWFNIAPESFARLNETVLSHDAIRGNVETELALPFQDSEAGCGCAYPDWVEETVVQRSNQIMQRLHHTALAFPVLQQRLAALPMWKRIDVGGMGVGVVHGDAESLAGWGFAPEHLQQAQHRQQVQRWFDEARLRIFACSHTCSPALCPIDNSAGTTCLVANNGAAGMPNFSGLAEGLLTRIATTPYTTGQACYGRRLGPLFVDAVPIRYDAAEWQAAFLQQWPPGSAAYESYWSRISRGPAYRIDQACAAFDATTTGACHATE